MRPMRSRRDLSLTAGPRSS